MTGKKWKLVVHPLSGNTSLHQFEIEAANWMGALRSARRELGEEGGLPSGASCAVTPDGTVTILDGEARRRFVLTPLTPVTDPRQTDMRPLPEQNPRGVKPAKFRTVAYATSPLATPHAPDPQQPSAAALPAQHGASQAASAGAPAPARRIASGAASPSNLSARPISAAVAPPPAGAAQARSHRAASAARVNAPETPHRTDTADQKAAAAPTSTLSVPTPAGTLGARKMQLELMLSRDVEPGPENPLTYRERAYLIPKGMSVGEAEAALRFALAEMQRQFAGAPRGKFVNLAAFDHNWIDRPARPPLVSLEWRDWRGEPAVDYPAAAASMPPSAPEGDERLAIVFESLHELAHLHTAAEGLEFSVQVLANTVACEALSGCLYDINTDELRLVALLGPGAEAAQGKAVARTEGLFGKAAQLEHAALVIPDLKIEAAYDPAREGRSGLHATNMLLRPLTHEGRLLGMLQLINRTTGGFSTSDVHLVNYVAERLAEFLRDARARISH